MKADLLMCYQIIHGLLDVQSRDILLLHAVSAEPGLSQLLS